MYYSSGKLRSLREASTLLNVDRGVPEVFNSTYDVRTQLSALGHLRDGKELDIPGPDLLRKLLMTKLESTEVGELLKAAHLISD
jgi:oleate hydratase